MASRTPPTPSDPGAGSPAAPDAVPRPHAPFAPHPPHPQLCYQTFGSADDEPLLLVMGLGGPMTWWEPELCTMLAEAGFYVVRYDNRDAGRSSRGAGRVTRSMLLRGFSGVPTRPPYTLDDLAGDAVGLLDHLGLPSAHVAGVSMGGMIAQTMAITAPDRVRSLASIMSTTGRRNVGWQHPSLLRTLLGRSSGREDYIRSSVATWRLIGSPGYPKAPDATEKRAAETYDRGVSAAGVTRQMAAIVTQRDRGPHLRSVSVPTVVIHGLADKMVHVSGGRATAAAVPGAELLLIDQMGHDLPSELNPTFTRAIRGNADRARAKA